MNFDLRTRLFISLAATFIACLLVGDIIGGKLQEVNVAGYGFVISIGMIPFPVTFLLTDLLNEFYGKQAARFVTWVGFAMAVMTLLILFIAVWLPWPEFTRASDWKGVSEGSFNSIFGSSQRIYLASLVAYLISQFVDIAVFHALKQLTANRMLWLRATGSTAVSQLIDTAVITTLAWWGLLPAEKIVSLVITSYAVKLVVAIGLTPLIYAGHALLERWFDLRPIEVPAAK